jgi:PAS domain S-box-containing protein
METVTHSSSDRHVTSASLGASIPDLTLFETIPDGFFALDIDRRFTYLNQVAEKLLGHSRDELIGQKIWESFPEAFHLRFGTSIENAINENVPIDVQDYFPPHKRWYQVYGHATEDGIHAFFRDVTEKVDTERRLSRVENKLKCLFESSLIGIAAGGIDGVVTESNDALLKMLGYDRADLIAGKFSWREFTPPEHQQATNDVANAVLDTGESQVYEKEYLRKDGTRLPVIVGVSLYDRSEKQFIVFVLDISVQKENEKRRQALVEANEAIKLRDQFCAIASHELKTPLTSINMRID